MEKKFETPEVEAVKFDPKDVIVSSPLTEGGTDEGETEIGF